MLSEIDQLIAQMERFVEKKEMTKKYPINRSKIEICHKNQGTF